MSRSRYPTKPAFLIIITGIVLLAVASGHHYDEVFNINQRLGPLLAFFLDGTLAAVVIYAGYWLSNTELPVENQWSVWRWSLAGGSLSTTVVGLTIFIRIYEGRVITEPIFIFLVATEVGILAGLIAGYNTANARLLAEQTREANEQLEALSSELKASNQRLEQFASTLSHDLQEPLRMVSSYVQLLESEYSDDLDEDAQEYMEYAVKGADRMQSMVESLLKYSRITDDEDSMEPVDTGEILDAVLEDLQLHIEETEATITTDELPTVYANREQLELIFRNLIENALQYSGDDPPEIKVSAKPDDDMWLFSVHDEGIGIDPDHQDDIFDMFEQIDVNNNNSGTAGMGLALCERIINHHDGDISVDSEPGTGTTFTFTLPMTDGDE